VGLGSVWYKGLEEIMRISSEVREKIGYAGSGILGRDI